MIDVTVNMGQATAITECIISYISNRFTNGDALQAATILKRLVTDGGDGVGDDHTRQASAIIEGPVADGGDIVGYGDACQSAATIECTAAN